MSDAPTRSCPETASPVAWRWKWAEGDFWKYSDDADMARVVSAASGKSVVAEPLYPLPQPVGVAQARQVPDGYVIMPREATRVMTMAGCDSLPSCEHVFGHAGEMLANAYRKMVEVCGHTSVPSTDSPAQTASEQSILLDLAAKFRKEHSSVFSGNNVATALAEAASALPSTGGDGL